MTYTLNGIGTAHVGIRQLTRDELAKWRRHLPKIIPIKKDGSAFDRHFDRKDFGMPPKSATDDLVFYEIPDSAYFICVESFVIFGLPLFPLKIPVLVFLKENEYLEVYHPLGKMDNFPFNIDWNFVGSLWQYKFTAIAVLTLAVTLVFKYDFWGAMAVIGGTWIGIIFLIHMSNFLKGIIGWVTEKVYGKGNV